MGGALCLGLLACLGLAGGAALAMPMARLGSALWRQIVVPGIPLGNNPQQVRIQQHFSIRIGPGAVGAPPGLIFEMEQEERATRMEERRMGRCLPVGVIAAVQSADNNRLVLYLRDSRVVVVALAKACRANDFYSGFYVERNADGQLCVERDEIHARSGATCTIRDMRSLAEVTSRRLP